MVAVLTRRALGRATLARQMLLERSDRGVLEAVEHLVGLQAQAPFPPYYALWSRLADFDPDRLAELVTDRSVVRIALMRSTVHLVSAADARLLRPLTQPAMVRGVRGTAWGRQIAHIDPEEIAAAVRADLAEAPLTGHEIGTRLTARWPDAPAQGLAIMARALVPQIQVPPRGVWGRSGQARLTMLSTWLGTDVDPAPSVDTVVLRYLGAFGPASVADAQAWSGMTGLAEVFDRLAPKLAALRGPGSATLYDLPDAPRPDPDTPVPVRYTAEWDNLCLSHADRERVLADDDRRRWWTANGIIPGMVLVDGVAGAAWRIDRARGAATLTITPFRPVPREHLDAVHAEGAALLRFAAPGAVHDVQVSTAPAPG